MEAVEIVASVRWTEICLHPQGMAPTTEISHTRRQVSEAVIGRYNFLCNKFFHKVLLGVSDV